MKKTFGIIALAALVMLAGCKKNEQPTGSTKLIAGIEQQKSDSKTSLDGLQIKWTADDKLYVYDKDAEEGAIFTLSSGAGTSTGEFTGTYNFTNENVAVYPSSSFSGSGGTIVTMTLPAEQTASASGTFGNGANPMLGVFSDFNNLTLKSLCGVLCLQLTGNNVNITAIEIVGGPDDKLNGTFTANYKDTDPVLIKTGDNGNNTVTLNCTATLTSTAQKFYVVLPANTLANGFTMKVYNGDNEIFSKSTTHDITMHLNTIETMDPLHIELWDGNLSTLTGSEPAGYATATNGMTIYGTLAATANNVKVSIADGANVTLQDATIAGQSFSSYNYAGLNLLGSANITLVGTSTMSGGEENAGIYVPENKTLTISGDGTINATGGQYAAGIGSNYLGSSGDIVITDGSATINATGGYAGAGIGSGYKAASECGNIEITDFFTGTVNATGHYGSPGIGSGNRSDCGNITISGGTINATGEDGGAVGNGAPGIGSGIDGSCGAITINESVTLVTAVKGNSAPCCIGKGNSASCGTITIGGTNYGTSGATSNQSDGLTFKYPNIVDIGVLVANSITEYTAQNGDILTGTTDGYLNIVIPRDVTVTLRNMTASGEYTPLMIECYNGGDYAGNTHIILEGNNSIMDFSQKTVENLTISGTGSLVYSFNFSTYRGCNTVIDGVTISGRSMSVGGGGLGDDNNFTINGATITLTQQLTANTYNGSTTNININDGNLTVKSDGWGYNPEPGIGSNTAANVNVTVTGDSNITFNATDNYFSGVYFIAGSTITFGTTDVKEAWYAKTWSADEYQDFSLYRATYTASTKTLVLAKP